VLVASESPTALSRSDGQFRTGSASTTASRSLAGVESAREGSVDSFFEEYAGLRRPW
jgi:hypothetical protein